LRPQANGASFAPAAMSRILDIAVETVLSLFGVAFIVWILIRTLKRTQDPSKLIFKWAFTLVFAFFCIRLAVQLGPFGPFVIPSSCRSCGRRTSANGWPSR
jgi:hypothetical protein